MSKEMSIDEAVNAAMDGVDGEEVAEDAGDASGATEGSVDNEEEVTEEEEEVTNPEEFSAEQLEHAKQLYRRLSNPATSVSTISEMVRQAGFTLAEAKSASAAEKKEIAFDVIEVFKEELGDDYELLSGPKLVQALSKVLDFKVSEALKPLQTKLDQAENDSRKKDVDKALDWAYTSLDGFKKNESLIAEKMQSYPYAGKTSYQTYLSEMHALATSGAATKRTQRAETNAKHDVKTSKSVRPSATTPSKAMSLDEAIEMAFANVK